MANFNEFFSAPSFSHPFDDMTSFRHQFDDIFSGASFLFPKTRERHRLAEPRAPAANRKHKHKSIPINVDGPDTKAKRSAANRKHESIQIHVDGPDTKAKGQRRADDDQQAFRVKAAAPVAAKRLAPPSAEAAAVRLQAAARGFLARRSVKAVRKVERQAERVERILGQSEEELRGHPSARVTAGEYLMGLLLRLDAVRRARDYRRRVTRKVIALQEAVDALEPTKAPAEDQIAGENAAAAPVLTSQEAAPETATESDVAAKAVAEEAEAASDDANPDNDKPEGSDAEWEILKEEKPAATEPACHEAPRHVPAGAANSGTAGIVDTGKLMEIVAALCERNAEQCALIHALTERLDALERTVRRA